MRGNDFAVSGYPIHVVGDSGLSGMWSDLMDSWIEFRSAPHKDFETHGRRDVESYTQKLKENKSINLEGVLKYLFLKSRQSQYRTLLSFIDQDDQLFMENIFAVNDRYIENKDIDKIKILFRRNVNNSSIIIRFLMFRFRTNFYEKLNINILIEIIRSLNSEEYFDLINPVFKAIDRDDYRYRYRYYTPDHFHYDIIKLTIDLKRLLRHTDFNQNDEYHNVFHFYALLLGVHSMKYGGTSHRVMELYKEYIKRYPNEAIDILMKCHDIEIVEIKMEIFSLLSYCIESNIEISKDFTQNIYSKYKNKDIDDQVRSSPFRFLEDAFNKYPVMCDNYNSHLTTIIIPVEGRS